MLHRRILTTLAAALLATPIIAAPVRAAPPAQLRQLLDAVHTAGMPGLFAQVRDGRRTWNLASGVADLETGRPARPDVRHRVGSITKTLVATTVLQLVGEGRVRLDAPIARYLPGAVPGELGRQVTVRMLLNHTSGLGDYDHVLLADYATVEATRFRVFRPAELVRIGLSQPPTGAPGERWSYSNTNYVLLSQLIEKITGHRYAAELSRRILRPVGMRDSYLPGADPRIRGPHLQAYVIWSDGNPRDLTVYSPTWSWGVGDLISTAADINRFFRALLTGRLLSPALLNEMKTTVPVDPSVPEAGGYGLGLISQVLPCGQFWGHTGGVVGHTTFSFHSTDAERQFTVGENLIRYEGTAIDEARNALLTGAACGTGSAPVMIVR